MTGDPQPADGALDLALQSNPGTVTQLLEFLAGEPVDADIRHQLEGPAGAGNPLGLAPSAPLLCRAVLLTGRDSGHPFVYAESAIAVDRIPRSVRRRLETSRDPIGRVLLDHRLVVRREPLLDPVEATPVYGDVVPLLGGAVRSRRYRIILDRDPAMVVSEWFLRSVSDLLAAHAGPTPGGDR